MALALDRLAAEIARIETCRWQGRVAEVGKGIISVTGLSQFAALGDMVEIRPNGTEPFWGEVLSILGDRLTILPDGPLEGVQLNDPVRLLGESRIAPDNSWLGKVLDPYGRTIGDGKASSGTVERPLSGEPIPATSRNQMGARVETGLALFNTILPIARGQRLGLFAGSGVGKSTLLGKLVRGVEADVVVLAMIGERGREVREFVERILGPAALKRTVIICATADQSPLLRRRSALAAISVAEHFREQGLQVLLLADSLTRFAEAHREIALATGEAATLGGYPPSTTALLTRYCERAGPGPEGQGDITAIFSILVPGSDMDEPVADILRGVLDGHIVLDRDIAERGRFPAVDVLRSVSRCLPDVATEDENALIALARKRLGCYAKNEMMIRAGLYTHGSDAEIDLAIAAFDRLDAFFAENEIQNTTNSFARLAACLTLPEDTGPS